MGDGEKEGSASSGTTCKPSLDKWSSTQSKLSG